MVDIGEVDFDVFKALTARRATETTTYNDVLRELLGLLPRDGGLKPTAPTEEEGDTFLQSLARSDDAWEYRGVRFPNDTEFRANYKGKTYTALVENGVLKLNGKIVESPSEAAREVTGTSVNGWRFWECRRPGESRWRLIDALR